MQKPNLSNKIVKSIFSSFSFVIINSIGAIYISSYVIQQLGAELLGIWAIVNALTSLGNIVNLGLGNSLPRFIASNVSKNNYIYASKLIGTSIISTILITVPLLLLIFYISKLSNFSIVGGTYKLLIEDLLYYTLINFGLSNLNSVILLTFDGYSKMYLRSRIQIIGSIINIFLSILLVQKFELKGLAYSQIAQQIVILFFGVYYLIKNSMIYKKYIFIFYRECFKELFSYSLKIQIINLVQIFSDPLMKFLFSKFGDLKITAYYELVQRIFGAIRNLIVVVNQVVIPEIAKNENKSEIIFSMVYTNNRIVNFISIIFFSFPFLFEYFLSFYWFNNWNSIFSIIFTFVAIGLFINTSALPFYMYYLGIGKLKFNVISNIIASLTISIFGTLLGYYFGYIGILYGWLFACILGAFIISYPFIKERKSEISLFLKTEDIHLFFASIVIVISILYLDNNILIKLFSPIQILSINLIIYLPLISFFVIKHSAFEYITDFILKKN